jgi:hypothetical protein
MAIQPPTIPWLTGNVVTSDRRRSDTPHVEVVDEPLCSASEVRRAVLVGAITSGLLSALVGAAFGYALGLRDGREE